MPQMARWTGPVDEAVVSIELDEPEQLAVSEIVVQAMYRSIDEDVMKRMSVAEIMKAMLLADRLSVPSKLVCEPAVRILINRCSVEWQELLQLLVGAVPALPEFFAPVVAEVCWAWSRQVGAVTHADTLSSVLACPHAQSMQRLLVHVYSNLERCWADEQLRKQLMDLSPAGMLLLLSSDELKAAGEETVLFTAEAWIMDGRDRPSSQQIRSLHQQVRFRHLTVEGRLRALASGIPEYSSREVRAYVQLEVAYEGADVPIGHIRDFVEDPPDRWVLPPRQTTTPAISRCKEASCRVSVEELRRVCKRHRHHDYVFLGSSGMVLLPGGQALQASVTVAWDEERQAASVGVCYAARVPWHRAGQSRDHRAHGSAADDRRPRRRRGRHGQQRKRRDDDDRRRHGGWMG